MIEEITGLLEREKITTKAIHHANRHRVVLIKGTTGVGKSALLEHIADTLDNSNKIPAIFIYHCTPYKQFLMDIIYQMFKRDILPEETLGKEWDDIYKEYNRGHSRNALTLIYTVIEHHPELIICVDNIDTASQHGIALFRQLLAFQHPPRIIATATSYQRLKYLVWQAELITIPPLSKKAVFHIVDQYIIAKGMRVDAPKMFKAQIYAISAGNPLSIANKLKYCRYEPRVKKHFLKGHNISSGRVEMNMGFIIILLFVAAMMSRYIARSVGDTHLYMFSSIIAALTIGGRYFIFKGSGKEEV